jgi:hypothetical protein
MFILDVPPEQPREMPVLMAQVDQCAGGGCRNTRPDPEVPIETWYQISESHQFRVTLTPLVFLFWVSINF